MKSETLAHMGLQLSKTSLESLHTIATQLINQEDLYTSPVVERINGFVTDAAHLTIYFGLTPEAITDSRIQKMIRQFEPCSVEVEGVTVWNGYNNLYKIVLLNIIPNETIVNLFAQASQLHSLIEYKEYEFTPHITLAYVDNSFELPIVPLVFAPLEVTKLYVSF